MNRKSSLLHSFLQPIQLVLLLSILVGTIVRASLVNLTPYWEEVALGYDAYSIAQTLKDHHGNFFPLVAFESFGDDKPALYFYLAAVTVKLFGLSIWAVRLPSLLAGIVLIPTMYLLVKELLSSMKVSQTIAQWLPVVAAWLIALNPWAIHFSRTAWEVNVATFFITVALLFGLRLQRDQGRQLVNGLLTLLFLILAMYCYHAARVISPLLAVVLFLPLLFQRKLSVRKFIVWTVFGGAMVLPFFFAWQSGQLSQRFRETSYFSNLSIIEQSNSLKESDGNTVFARLAHHRYLLFSKEIAESYLSHFSGNFLFLQGDKNPRHGSQLFGLFYYTDILLLLSGAAVLIPLALKKYTYFSIASWLLISIFPAALTTGTPHALRILPSMPAFIVLLTLGVLYLWQSIDTDLIKKLILGSLLLLTVTQSAAYLYHLWFTYPKQTALEWQYGYQQLVETVNQQQREGESVYITREQGRPAMYYWFFSRTSPQLVQQADAYVSKDQGEFLQFENIHFVDRLEQGYSGLMAGSQSQYQAMGGGEVLATILNPATQKPVWVVFRR